MQIVEVENVARDGPPPPLAKLGDPAEDRFLRGRDADRRRVEQRRVGQRKIGGGGFELCRPFRESARDRAALLCCFH